MIKTAKELAAACIDVARNYKTLYVMGCFGAPMTESNKIRYISHHSYNQRAARTAMIQAASADTFGFDCVCLIKAMLWGWDGDASHVYGGASYGSNGVPDIGTEQIIGICKDVSTDFGNMQVGELLWMKGHVGIYIGDGNAVECTPGWKNGVQITVVRNIKSGNGHLWTKHGKLPYVTYEDAFPIAPAEKPQEAEKGTAAVTGLPMLRKGSRGDTVQALQILLIGNDCSCGTAGVDGDFGAATENAVKDYQTKNSLVIDGIVGPMTWAKLLGLED